MAKDRVTLTLDKNILRQIDSSVDGTTIKNRSHAVELLLTQSLKGGLPSCAVILAGGTQEAVQGVLDALDGTPRIVHNIELLARHGIDTIYIVSKDPQTLQTVIGDGSDYHVSVHYITESTRLGTAGSLHLAQPYVTGPFIVLNADEFKDVDIRDLYNHHKKYGGHGTIALTTASDPSEHGVALLNGSRIIAFIEKPSAANAPSNLINAGLYIFEPTVFDVIPHGYASLETDVFPKLARDDRLIGYMFAGRYTGI